MKILFIAPFPPPITGQSLISDYIFAELKKNNQVNVINLSKSELKSGTFSLSRFFDFFSIFYNVVKQNRNSESVYLTISESILGNLKDLIIYFLLGNNIKKTILHVHGGSFKRHVLDKNNIVFKLNMFFLKKVCKIIVLGDSHKLMFDKNIFGDKMFSLPNFVQSDLFISSESIEEKFNSNCKIKILYLSNLIYEKGFDVLIEAFEKLDPLLSSKIELSFAGSFESTTDKELFKKRIVNYSNVFYHGIVYSEKKKALLSTSHILVLPSSFLEGQPLCILEAYANACSVIATTPPGINDIFINEHNGLAININDSDDLKNKIEFLINNRYLIKNHGLTNLQEAKEKYTSDIFLKNLNNLLK
jgi:glycosyltransferase involved in cell wall biosynthesis